MADSEDPEAKVRQFSTMCNSSAEEVQFLALLAFPSREPP